MSPSRETVAERLYRIACEPAMPGDPGHPADWPNAPDPITQAYRRMADAVLELLAAAEARGHQEALEQVALMFDAFAEGQDDKAEEYRGRPWMEHPCREAAKEHRENAAAIRALAAAAPETETM